MTPVRELRNQWKLWLNGLIHACYSALGTALGSAVVLEPLHALEVISSRTLWVSWASAIVSGIANGVIGYMKRSPIPDVFAVNPETGQFESDRKVLIADHATGNLVSTLKGEQAP